MTVAPYDILSIFGTNFCVTNGTGCTGGNSVLYGQIDPVTLRYLNVLSPDAPGATQRNITVTFQTHTTTPTAIANGPLLFAANNQINVAVPDAVKAYIGSTVDIVVSFGYGSIPSTMLKSAPYSVTVGATDPGVFTVGGDGQGDAAALSPTFALITNGAPAGARTGTDSDIVALYVAGLGRPDSDGTGTGYSATCMPTDGYWAAINAATSGFPGLDIGRWGGAATLLIPERRNTALHQSRVSRCSDRCRRDRRRYGEVCWMGFWIDRRSLSDQRPRFRSPRHLSRTPPAPSERPPPRRSICRW